jgi:drug/metabolite transporter (DMT)-like permease
MQLPLLFFVNNFPSMPTLSYAISCGVFLMLAQLGLVKAYRYASASQVGVYQYSSIVFVALIEWLIWAKIPGSMDLVGFILVSIAGIVIIRSKH